MNPLTPDLQAEFAPFLKSALGQREYQIFPLAGDASSRRYFRVVAEEESWVLMFWDPFIDDGRYPFLSVRNHFAAHGVHVPVVVAKAPNQGLVLLEDLGDLTLERKFWENQSQQVVLPFYKLAMDELIKIHYPATFDRSECTAFKIEFDVEKLTWEMNYGREHLLTGLCGLRLTDAEIRELDSVFNKICSTLHAEPKFIAHRDYHSRNVMIKLGQARVIDFQDARLGPIQYDLVSLLRDSYVRLENEVADELLAYYLERRKEFVGVGGLPLFSGEHFQRLYEIQTVQRCFKACGSFASFYNLRKDTRYLKYIPHTLQTVRKSLESFDEYKTFLDILEDWGLFEKKFDAL